MRNLCSLGDEDNRQRPLSVLGLLEKASKRGKMGELAIREVAEATVKPVGNGQNFEFYFE